jgi:hypothetical protein
MKKESSTIAEEECSPADMQRRIDALEEDLTTLRGRVQKLEEYVQINSDGKGLMDVLTESL